MSHKDPIQTAALYRGEVISSLVAMNARLNAFARNLEIQLRERSLTPPQFAKLAKVGAKTVNNVLNGRHGTRQDMLEKMAKALGLELWQMCLPDLPADAQHDDTLPRLIRNVIKLNPEAKARVAHIADLEVKASGVPADQHTPDSGAPRRRPSP